MIKLYTLLLGFLFINCSKDAVIKNSSIINTNHLEHLYEEVEIDDLKLGTIWIYSDAPNYKLVTDSDEGYTCVDDVSRALIFYCRQYKSNPINEYLEKIKSLSKFVLYMKAENGYYYNFLFPDKKINYVHKNSKPIPNFWSWRAYWSLSELCLLNSIELNEIQKEAKSHLSALTAKIEILFQDPSEQFEIDGFAISKWMEDYGGDQIGVIMLGLTNYYEINPSENLRNLIQRLGDAIISVQFGNENQFPHGAFMSWKNIWHAWGNTQSYALLKAGNTLNINYFLVNALEEVNSFYPYVMEQGFLHEFTIKKENDSFHTYDLRKFPQIAYSISPMILASIEAYNITKEEKYAIQAGNLGSWFYGKNAAKQIMYNTESGRVFDGIDSEDKVNINSGAESTIEALLSLQAIETSPLAIENLKIN